MAESREELLPEGEEEILKFFPDSPNRSHNNSRISTTNFKSCANEEELTRQMIAKKEERISGLNFSKGGTTTLSDNSKNSKRAMVDVAVADLDESQKVVLRWNKINFFSPAGSNDEDRGVNEETGSIVHGIIAHRKQNYKKRFKQILTDQSGYAAPGECVAIMGPSGSGKTSLLNIIGCRLHVSKRSYFSGDLTVNGIELDKDNFGKFGAYVQQDDIMIETMKPRELFRFACQMKCSHLSQIAIEKKVDGMLKRLKLWGCQNTMVGGVFMKGLSGGERKRTSIGYELITNPSLFLLDEPTSGLDSHTALQICKMLKKEAQRGMTILATIHQPSAEIFQVFDRVIILASGNTIYNSSTEN